MLITTFFIDGIKEVSIQTPNGIQEDGGVYGNSQNYSTWILGQDGDTTDFVGIPKTVILYGNLYKITLDTGNMFNPTIPGGTGNLNGFMNMDLQTYWENIFDGNFKLNNVSYTDYQLRLNTGIRGNQQVFPSLLEFASGVKQEIGWVEINRTRNSIYYESCNGGKGRLARSDQFYDMDSFIMTRNLFDTNSSNIGTFYYDINNNDFITNVVSAISLSPQTSQIQGSPRIGISPIDTIQENELQNFYFDNVPYPNRFSGNRNSNEYLKQLFFGVKQTLDATLNDGPIQKFVPSPIQRNKLLNNIPLLFANGRENSVGGQELVSEDQSGRILPVWSGYSKSIWAQYRISPSEQSGFENIENGFRSIVDSSTQGRCIAWEDGENRGLGERRKLDRKIGNRKRSTTESDPFDLANFKLDTPYEDFYDKIPCPTKKKLKGSDCLDVNKSNSYLINDIKDLLQTGGIKIIPVGAFNPDASVSFVDTSNLKFFNSKKINSIVGNINIPTPVIYRGPSNKKIDERLYQEVSNEPSTLTPLTSNFFGKNSRLFHENMEIGAGVRKSNLVIGTSAIFPHGTFKVSSEKKGNISELKIQQVGAECLDKNEFYKSVNFLKSVSRQSDKKLKPIGVDKYGYPVFETSDKMKGVIDSLLRDLFGFAEITLNGSDIKRGWYTTTWDSYQDTILDKSDFGFLQNYQFREAIVTPLYIEDDTTIGGEDIDENTNNTDRNLQAVRSGIASELKDIVYVNVGPVTNYWTKETVEPEMDQSKITPYLTSKNVNLYKRYNLNDAFEWGAFLSDAKIGFKQTLLDENVNFTPSEKRILTIKRLKIDELRDGVNKNAILNAGKPYKYKNTRRLATTYQSTDGYDVVIVPPTYYEYDYDDKCHKMDFDTNQKPGYSKFYAKCGVSKSSSEPIVQSDYPVINGWVLEGLYHRDASWGDKYGLIMTPELWNPSEARSCNCGTLGTGGWIKVNPDRIRLEKHSYNDYDLYWYNRYLNDGYARELVDVLKSTTSMSSGKPLYTDDQVLYLTLAHRNMHEWIVQNINGGNITIFLRTNDADRGRGLSDLRETLKGRSFSYGGQGSGQSDFIPDGLFEERVFVQYGANEFGFRYQSEPASHTSGEFDKTQTYRAVFRKFISGRSANDAIEKGTTIISSGISNVNKYKPTEFNKKVACEMLYVVESIYKMHRARLKEINNLMKNQIDAYGVTYADSPSESVNPRFDYYLSTVKKLHQAYKQKFITG